MATEPAWSHKEITGSSGSLPASQQSIKNMAAPQLARVSILGVGKMGAAAARRLAGLGYEVRVWNRSPDKARAIASDRIGLNGAQCSQLGLWK